MCTRTLDLPALEEDNGSTAWGDVTDLTGRHRVEKAAKAKGLGELGENEDAAAPVQVSLD